jgi:ribosome recycling factor
MYSFTPFQEAIKKLHEHLNTALGGIRTGRAAPAILDTIQVDNYGSTTPISHVANISIEDPRTLRVTPWDMTMCKHIEHAIAAASAR